MGRTDRSASGRMILLAQLFVLTCAGAAQAGIQFPMLTGRVVDLADLLPPAVEKTLRDKLAAHETATSSQIVVVTLPDLQGLEIADYGYQLGRYWGIGTKEHDNGALLIVAPKQRQVRIDVGYGLEGALTDALSRTIIEREILPRFKSGNMAAGIAAGVDAMLNAVAGEYLVPATDSGDDDPFVFVGLTAAIGGILGAMARARVEGLGRCGHAPGRRYRYLSFRPVPECRCGAVLRHPGDVRDRRRWSPSPSSFAEPRVWRASSS